MNIYEIAQLSNVSIATVSRVLNKDPKVRESTRKRVQDVIDNNSYTPSRSKHLSKEIAFLLVYDSCDQHNNAMLQKCAADLTLAGFTPYCICCHMDEFEKKDSLQKIVEKKPLAIVIYGPDWVSEKSQANQYLLEIAESFPLILINCGIKHDNIINILIDIKKNVIDYVKVFTQKGYRKPLLIIPKTNAQQNEYINYFKLALELNGIDVQPETVRICDPHTRSVDSYLDIMCSNELNPNIIYTTSSTLAAQINSYLIKHKLYIPLVSFCPTDLVIPQPESCDSKISSYISSSIQAIYAQKTAPQEIVLAPKLLYDAK